MEKVFPTSDIEKLKNIFLVLKKHYKEVDEDPLITLPEVFDKESQEGFLTSWLSYLLNPKTNGFGVEPLKALLRCIDIERAFDEDEVVIEREFTFSEYGKRIDILITTSDLIIGIENKLYSGESGEQTEFYWRGMSNLAKSNKQSLLGIYLKPEANMSTPKCKNFKTVTYTKLCNELRSIEHDHCRNHRKNFFFYEFLLYVEDKLMLKSETGFPEITEDVKLYHENQMLLEKLEQNYENYNKEVGNWLRNRIEETSKSKFYAKSPTKFYWQIIESADWDEDSFHFELLWDKTGKKSISALTEEDNVWLCVHLEKRGSKLKKLFNTRGNKPPYKRKITVDFSNEEKSKQSIDKIVEMLKTDEFKYFSGIANKYYLEKRELID